MFHIKPTFLNFLGRLRKSCFQVSYFPNISLSPSHNKKYRPFGQYSLFDNIHHRICGSSQHRIAFHEKGLYLHSHLTHWNDFIPLFFKMTHGKTLIINSIKADELKKFFLNLPKLDIRNTILISSCLNLICSRVIEQSAFEKCSQSDSILYQKVISYISKNFREEISLKKIAAKFGYNIKYLSHTLHSLTNTNFSDFVAMYRIESARELLIKNKELSIAEIAINCGFSAINTFNRQFKKMTHMTPTKYRKLYS